MPTTIGTVRGTSQPTRSTSAACCCPACQGLACLDRTRFFAGQLLSEADLNNEQSYWLAKGRLHNRFLHGWGVVCGMQVVCSECDGWVTVKSGYAIDPCGNDIIVCADQAFNVIKAIQSCCNATKQPTPNCSPLRYTPSPECQGSTQEWCITIQYQEQPSRLVTPLTAATSQSSSCGCCGSTNAGNGNGSSQTTMSNGSSCSATSTQTSTSTVPAGTCEPTRIVEGFLLGVVPAPEVNPESQGPLPGTLLYQLQQCSQGLVLLLQQAPDLSNVQDSQVAYQSTCNYLLAVNQYFAKNSAVTHCKILDDLAAIKVPAGADVPVYIGIVAEIKLLLVYALLDCVCFSLLPPCAPDPCDNRLILACVTVQDGSIVDICHFTGRKQLITLHDLHYWLGPFGVDNLLAAITKALASVCCAEEKQLSGFSNLSLGKAYDQEAINSAGVSNAAVLNRIAAHYVSQTLGASALNSIAPGARAVDLRPLVGQPMETVQRTLEQQGFKQVTPQSVDEDASWTPYAVASSAQFAPAAVSAGQPLTVYTKGTVAVGFDVVDPTTARLNDLQAQVTALQNQFNLKQNPSTS
ncbi:MAG: hypothetical protein WCC92_05730 [Candidatus Korobacteraceae bacterium]